jgi:hypothetical protein
MFHLGKHYCRQAIPLSNKGITHKAPWNIAADSTVFRDLTSVTCTAAQTALLLGPYHNRSLWTARKLLLTERFFV